MSQRRTDMIDKLDSVGYHLEGLRELVVSLPSEHEVREANFDDASLKAFGSWVLDLMGFAENGDVTGQVREARKLLVVLLARNAPVAEEGTSREPTPQRDDFEDLFTDADLEDEPELDIEPIDGIEQAV